MNKLLLITMLIGLNIVTAHSQTITTIPLPDEFIATLNMTNKYPIVHTGYLADSIESIISFYQQALGDPQKSKGNNTYHTLFYKYKKHTIRISLYRRDFMSEVSIIIE
jgi:hypothetical protein